MKVICGYQYKVIKNKEELRDKIKELCLSLNIKGRILIGQEGINAAVSGEDKSIEKFKEELKTIAFREQEITNPVYRRLIVRTRKEIVTINKKVDLKMKGKYIDPIEFKEIIDKGKEIVILDARNDYESKVGRFKGAITLPISNFREFPKAIKKLSSLKNKKIITYCTGGIRCEKASAVLKEEGFKEVYQLKGGIINYINQFKDNNFQGSCFVFDNRVTIKVSESISKCEFCSALTDQYINCHNLDCDKLLLCCLECQQKMRKTCSLECKEAPKQRKIIVSVSAFS